VDLRKAIVSRIAIIYFFLLIFGLVVIFKMISVQKLKNERWEQIAKNLEEVRMHAGDILGMTLQFYLKYPIFE